MTRLLVGIEMEATAEQLAAYCNQHLADDDVVHTVNSLVGGGETSAEDVSDGEAALDAFDAAYDWQVDKRSSLIRGNEPVVDLLDEADRWDADEFLIGIRKRSPVGKVVFGSTARDLLMESDLPVRAVPMVSD
ncbi:MAG: universal stress protein [Haloarculaceae archaeon]